MTGKFLKQIKQEKKKKLNKPKRKNWTKETQGKQMALPIRWIAGKTERDQGIEGDWKIK